MFELAQRDSAWVARFHAMASPCEVHFRLRDKSEASQLASLAVSEVQRLESKYSRYRDGNIVHAINNADGESIDIDDETVRLLRFAAECHAISDGLFDVTSGVLRRAWSFNGQVAEPDTNLIASLLKLVGWSQVELTDSTICMLPDMEIDLGGIVKEYAADKVAQVIADPAGAHVLFHL